MRGSVPGCTLVAFADLSSGMVLCTSAAAKRPQEELDALSTQATEMLSGAAAQSATALLEEERATLAVALTPRDMHVVCRAEGSGDEVLICLCAHGTDLSQVVDSARSALAGIAGQG